MAARFFSFVLALAVGLFGFMPLSHAAAPSAPSRHDHAANAHAHHGCCDDATPTESHAAECLRTVSQVALSTADTLPIPTIGAVFAPTTYEYPWTDAALGETRWRASPPPSPPRTALESVKLLL